MAPATPVGKAHGDLAVARLRDFEATYAEYFGFVWRCLRGLGVNEAGIDDAAQEVFVVVHRRLPEFRAEATLRTWLYGIVRNVAANHRRSQRRHPTGARVETEPPSPAPSPHDQLLTRERAAFVQRFLSELDEAKRDIFVLVLLEELTVPDVAEMLQIPLNTAYTRLRSVRHALERALAKRRGSER
jgi:RNA polymerase sigma-70 factor (ECF subfamily)